MLRAMPRLGLLGPGALVPFLAWLVTAGCGDSSACTELDCVSEAIVTFPAGLVSGPYDLVIEGQGQRATARCNDSAAETLDNPEGLACNAQGFTLEGHPLANEREVVVTVIPEVVVEGEAEPGEPVTEAVRLEAVDEVTPNGPDCPPLCVIRHGQLRRTTGP
jgi:hypothetical protein